jgi:PAS domain S-box-containing protein
MSESTRKTILLVEDEAILAMTEKMQLEKYGYAVKTVNTGEKAIEAVKTIPEIDLVLMDINLGDGIDGTEAAEIILKDHDIPIVFVSSHTEREVVEKTEKITSYGYVVKNSSMTVLDASIKMAFKLYLAKEDIRNHLEKANQLLVEKTEIERRLRKNEHNHLEAQKIAHFGNYEIDLQTNTAKWSDETFKIFDWNPTVDTAPTVEDYQKLIHPDDVTTVYSHFNETVQNKKVFDLEYRIITKKGHIKNVHSYGYPLTNETGQVEVLYGVFQDITERIKANNELISAKENAEKSESRLQGILDNMVDAFFQADKNGVFTYANQSALRMYGYSSLDELIGKPASNLYANKEERDELLQEIRKTGRKIGWTGRALRKDGSTFWVSMNVQVVRDKVGNIIGTQGVTHDISDRKNAEEELRKSEEKYRLISENTSDGIVHFSPDGKIDYLSPSYLRQLGYAEDEELGCGYDSISPEIHPDDRDVLFASIYKSIEEKRLELTYTYRVKHSKGYYIWREDHANFLYNESGAYLGAYVSCRDITERKNTENKLALLNKAIEASPAIIIITDVKGNIEYVNPRFSCITGYSSDEVIGKNPRFLKSGKTDEGVYLDMWNTLTSGGEWRGYFRNKKRNGDFYYESATIAPVKNEKGETTNYIAIKEDLTEKRYMQESLEESNIRFNTLAGSQSVLIWESGTDKLCNYFNQTWLSYTGRTIEEELGNGWVQGVHPDDVDRCLKIYTESFDKRQEFSIEYRLRKENGEYGWIFDHGSPKYHNQEFIGYIGSCVDISQVKNFEKILRESEEKYRLLHEFAGVGIGYYSPDGRVLSYNQLAAKNMGGVPEDFIGKSMFDLFPKADAEVYYDRILKAIDSSTSDVYEDMVSLPSGKMYFLSTFTKILDAQSNLLGIQIISQNITDRKRTETALQLKNEEYEALNEELRSTTEELQVQNEELIQAQELLLQSEKRLNQAEKVAKIGNWTLQISTNTMIASNGASEIYGVDFNKVSLAVVQNIPLPEYRSLLDIALSDLIHLNKPYDIEFKIRRPIDGNIRDMHSVATYDKRTNLVFGVIQDVTDRKRDEEELREKEEKYRFALEGSNLGEWDWNYKSGIVVRNARWAEMLGYSPEELDSTIQQGVDLMHPDDIPIVKRLTQEHFDGITDHYNIEYRMKTKNGEYKWIRDSGKIMVRDSDGNPLRLCGIHEDIDEGKRIRDRIDSLLAEKELLLKEVHHRIKNSMNTIRSLISLQENAVVESSTKLALQDAENRIQSMSMLYDKLYQSLDYKELSIRDYLTTLVDGVITNFPNGRMVKVVKEIDNVVVNTKKLQPIGIIVNELLTNIMKYAFNGRENGVISVSATNINRRMQISVKDDGIGMPESVSFQNSTGFGLQLVEAMTKQLNGTIQIMRINGTKVVLEVDL